MNKILLLLLGCAVCLSSCQKDLRTPPGEETVKAVSPSIRALGLRSMSDPGTGPQNSVSDLTNYLASITGVSVGSITYSAQTGVFQIFGGEPIDRNLLNQFYNNYLEDQQNIE